MVNRAESAETCPGEQVSWQAHCEISESSPCRDRKLPEPRSLRQTGRPRLAQRARDQRG